MPIVSKQPRRTWLDLWLDITEFDVHEPPKSLSSQICDLEATTASKQPWRSNPYLRFELSDLDYQHIHVHIAYMVWSLFVASVPKEPRRTSHKKFVAQMIIYAASFVLPVWWSVHSLWKKINKTYTHIYRPEPIVCLQSCFGVVYLQPN